GQPGHGPRTASCESAEQAAAAVSDRSEEPAKETDARGLPIAGGADHLSRDSTHLDGWFAAARRWRVRHHGATTRQRAGLYHHRVRGWIYSAALLPGPNHPEPSERIALGSCGCTRLDGRVC